MTTPAPTGESIQSGMTHPGDRAGAPQAIEAAARPDRDRAWLPALAFGVTSTMWAIGYVCRIPPAWVPGPLLVALLVACVVAGGYAAGRFTGAGVRGGIAVGLLSSFLNLLILGSLIGEGSPRGGFPPAAIWLPATFFFGALLGAAGAAWGARARSRSVDLSARGIDWTAVFAIVAAGATYCLLVIGGLVTSREAGLDVPDWPGSFGYTMFLYPFSRMSGGIYYEHSHRLFGSLVGLTTLVLAIHLQRADRRRWVRLAALAALVLVIVQGVMGGFRVTTAEIQADAGRVVAYSETAQSLVLRVVHGVTGQLFFGLMVALAAFTSARWKSAHAPTVRVSASTDHGLSAVLVAGLMVQLILGALLRHLSKGLFIHIGMATVVLVLGVLVGARAAGLPHGQPILARLGRWILWAVSLQIVLGVAALAVTFSAGGRVPPPISETIVTTAHQALGAALLGAAILLAVWSRRLLVASCHRTRLETHTDRTSIASAHQDHI